MKLSGPQQVLIALCEQEGLPVPVGELIFHPHRKWRFDLSWPDQRLALEIEGGVFVRGRHSRGAGFRSDCEKYAEALIHGWRVLRILPEHVTNGQALIWIRRALRGSGQ